MNQKAVYPGTFDPITNGHVDIITRAAKLFSNLVVAVAESNTKKPYLPLTQRLELIKEVTAHLNNVSVLSFNSLLMDFVKQENADIVVRGLRSTKDFEFEFQLAGMNRKLAPEVETIFLTPAENLLFISSSLVREIASFGGDVKAFVPKAVLNVMRNKKG